LWNAYYSIDYAPLCDYVLFDYARRDVRAQYLKTMWDKTGVLAYLDDVDGRPANAKYSEQVMAFAQEQKIVPEASMDATDRYGRSGVVFRRWT